jgi:hypothetical protein
MGVPLAATLGRTNPADGQLKGAEQLRDQMWSGMDKNDADQGAVNRGAGYMNQQSAEQRGPQARENTTLANNFASGAGGHQQGAMGLANTLARGQQPSQAAFQLQAGLNQASNMQTSMGRSARGGAALATAGANAQANTANLQQNAWTQGGMLRSKDMAAGRGMLTSAVGQARDQAGQRLSQTNDMMAGNQGRNDQYSINSGKAAVGLGNVANGMAGQDLQYYQGGMEAVEAQSEALQMRQDWLADAEKQRIAALREDD